MWHLFTPLHSRPEAGRYWEAMRLLLFGAIFMHTPGPVQSIRTLQFALPPLHKEMKGFRAIVTEIMNKF
jgi:hypothetical protein